AQFHQRRDAEADGQFVPPCQGTEPHQGQERVGGGGQVVRFEKVGYAVAISKVESAMPLDAVGDTEAFVEVQQVGAALEQNVLAVVEHLAGRRIDKTGGPSAEPLAGLNKRDRDAGLRQ